MKTAIGFGAVLAAILALAGCGGGSDPDANVGAVTGGSPQSNPPNNPPNTPPGAPPSGGNENPSTPPKPTEIGTPIGAIVSAVIDSTGGTLSSADGAIAIDVPAGAFDAPRTVSIQEITNTAHGANGRAYRISPEGLHTPAPMTIRFRYTDNDLFGTALPFMSIAYQDANRLWRVYKSPAVNAADKTLAVQTDHFSDWSMVAGVQLLPKSARVRTGDSLELLVVHCESEPETESDDELVVPLVLHECKPSPLNAFASRNWSVNGTVGGSARFGTVVAHPDRASGKATFTAPTSKPTPNVVAVSAQHELIDGLQLLVSNITIEDQLVECATLKNVSRFNAELSFDQFSFVATAENYRHTGTHAGMLRGTLQRVQTGPEFGFWISYLSPLTAGHVYINDAYEYTPPSGDGYTGSLNAQGAPHDDINAPSFIGLKVNYATCTFDLFGSFIGDGTIVHDGQTRNALIGIGGLYLFAQPIVIEQATPGLLHGSLAVNARDSVEQTGYKPVEPVSTEWNVAGGTVARWRIEAIE
jgi:hypothetical protein